METRRFIPLMLAGVFIGYVVLEDLEMIDPKQYHVPENLYSVRGLVATQTSVVASGTSISTTTTL